MENPLLNTRGVPRFRAIRPEHIEPALTQRLGEHRDLLDAVCGQDAPTWESLIAPLDAAMERIEWAWGPVEHLNAVCNDEALREVYRRAKPLLAEHWARVAQDERLYAATRRLAERAEELGLDAQQRRVLELWLRDFRLAGVDLPAHAKERYRAIQVELSQLSARFQDNLIDVTRAYRLILEDPKQLAGLPESLVAAARSQALEDDPEAPPQRWSFTLHAPSYRPFVQYQRDRALREEMHRAHRTRASSGEQDNAPLIARILALRVELAELLGFPTYAERSLATKMARSAAEVRAFLEDLAERALPHARRERDELEAFARAEDGLSELAAHDVAHYRERLRQARFAYSNEELRAYFPLPRVLRGLFATLRRLYGLELRELTDPAARGLETWHPDVRVVEVLDAEDAPRGFIYLDLLARDGKRQGAWMNRCVDRCRVTDGGVQTPVAYLNCNFSPATGGSPPLLRHRELKTLFHEMGHVLHHVLSRVDRRPLSGIREVPWDGIELPSQMHENWVWQPESLADLGAHVESGEALPARLVEPLLAARRFMSGTDMLAQLELALFDLELHTRFAPGGQRSVADVLAEVRARLKVLPTAPYDRFQNGFAHIFAGSYAAGYYSYKWAEVLAADAFSRFEEEGLFSPAAGADFRTHILERGGSAELMELYVAFRGREPTAEALLRQAGLVAAL